jgi:type IV pilus assembly protein PilE
MTLIRRQHHGFTLIEVMIVVAIIAILGAVAYPSYVSQIAKGKRAECRSGLLQSMQQQERYFTQYNTYAKFSTYGDATAKTKAFSGENRTASACLLAAENCTAPGSTDIARCVEVRAQPVKADSSIDYIYVDSDGNKGCSVSGARTTSNKTCWP